MENEAENELHFNILISPVFGQIGLGHSPPIEPESSQGSSVKANITCLESGAEKWHGFTPFFRVAFQAPRYDFAYVLNAGLYGGIQYLPFLPSLRATKIGVFYGSSII